jgi:hypothetical protein
VHLPATEAATEPASTLRHADTHRPPEIPTLARCAEFGRMHVHNGELPFRELPRF